MVEYTIPFTGQEVDSDDPDGSAVRVVYAVLAMLTLFGVTSAAAFLFQRSKQMLGVEGDAQIPGV